MVTEKQLDQLLDEFKQLQNTLQTETRLLNENMRMYVATYGLPALLNVAVDTVVLDNQTSAPRYGCAIQKESNSSYFVRSIYRAVALRTHPDKHGGSQQVFQEVERCMREKKIMALLCIATDHHVVIPYNRITHEDMCTMVVELEDTRRRIASMQSCPLSVWRNNLK